MIVWRKCLWGGRVEVIQHKTHMHRRWICLQLDAGALDWPDWHYWIPSRKMKAKADVNQLIVQGREGGNHRSLNYQRWLDKLTNKWTVELTIRHVTLNCERSEHRWRWRRKYQKINSEWLVDIYQQIRDQPIISRQSHQVQMMMCSVYLLIRKGPGKRKKPATLR